MNIAYFGFQKKFHSPQSLIKASKKTNDSILFFNIELCTFQNGVLFYDTKKFDFSHIDAAIVRSHDNITYDNHVRKLTASYHIISLLKKYNIPTLNGTFYLKNPFFDKFSQSLLFSKYDISTIPTIHPVSNVYAIQHTLPWDFPIILKETDGSFGLSVYKIKSQNELKKWILHNKNKDIILQKFIKNSCDYRVIVCGNTVIGAIKRSSNKDGWKHNYSQGAHIEKYHDKKMFAFAKTVAQKIKSDYVGIDIIMDNNGNFFVIEINLSANFAGFEKIHGTQFVSTHIINTLKNNILT